MIKLKKFFKITLPNCYRQFGKLHFYKFNREEDKVKLKRVFCLFFVLVISGFPFLHSFDIPERPIGRVNDFANIIEEEDESKLEHILMNYELRTTNQLVVVTIPSLEGEDIENYSIRLAEKWKIGQKGLDNGIIILVAMKERKIRIEVGYGLESKVTDAIASKIIRDYIVPYFRKGDYTLGIYEGVSKIIELTSGDKQTENEETTAGRGNKLVSLAIMILVILAFFIFVDLIRFIFFIFSPLRYEYGLWEWISLFSITYIFFKLIFLSIGMGSGRGSYTIGGGMGPSGHHWGGFSGGGGSFGGGGASGSW